MSFNPSIPEISNFVAISQGQLLANFQQIYNAFAQNHIMLATNNQGRHSSLTMRVQSVDPSTASNQAALYCKLDANSVPQMFFRASSNQTPIQMTNSNLNTVNGAAGSSFMAGPFTIYFGYVLDAVQNQTVTLTPSSQILYVGLTAINNANTSLVAPVNVDVNTFQIQYSRLTNPNVSVYYTAIGTS